LGKKNCFLITRRSSLLLGISYLDLKKPLLNLKHIFNLWIWMKTKHDVTSTYWHKKFLKSNPMIHYFLIFSNQLLWCCPHLYWCLLFQTKMVFFSNTSSLWTFKISSSYAYICECGFFVYEPSNCLLLLHMRSWWSW